MAAQVIRRIQLPADRTSPRAARAAVRAAIDEAGISPILDEALLLTTELCTNVVVHARTGLELEILADPGSITVTVMDYRTGLFTDRRWTLARSGQGGPDQAGSDSRPREGREELEERGRGLLLVDQIANCWGTLHHPGGKGVWFRLDLDTADEQLRANIAAPSTAAAIARGGSIHPRPEADAGVPDAGVPDAAPPSRQAPSVEALTRLTGLPDRTSLTEAGEDQLQRLCPVVGADGAALIVDADDGNGPQLAAAYGVPVGDSGLRVSLNLSGSWSGVLALTPTANPYTTALAALAAERLALVVENLRLQQADNERRTGLTFLAEASELLAQSLDVDLTLALIPRLVVPRLGVWCAVHTTDDTGQLRLAAATHADEAKLPALLHSLDDALPQLHTALKAEALMPLAGPAGGYAIALLARGQQLGTLAVGREGGRWRGTEHLTMVEDVARRSALAVDNARIHAERRAVAEALQRSLLPPALPHIDGMDLGAEYVPTGAGAEVGGDFYDVVALPDRRWLVVVGDVSGKGVQAATVTGLVRDVTRVLVRDGRPLSDALARLNETLVDRGGGRFCTLALADVRPDGAGGLKVRLYLAGHDQPVLLRPDGTTSLVGRYGTALGLLDKVSSPPTRLTLTPGEALIFYTDGVTERRRGADLFGSGRLRTEASRLAGLTAAEVASRLRLTTLGFSTDPPRDDIAIFVLRNG